MVELEFRPSPARFRQLHVVVSQRGIVQDLRQRVRRAGHGEFVPGLSCRKVRLRFRELGLLLAQLVAGDIVLVLVACQDEVNCGGVVLKVLF